MAMMVFRANFLVMNFMHNNCEMGETIQPTALTTEQKKTHTHTPSRHIYVL